MHANESKSAAIVRLSTKEGWTYRESRTIGLGNSLISKTLRHFNNTQEVISPNPVGRPYKVLPIMRLFVESQALQNPRMSIEDVRNAIRDNFQISVAVGTISKIRADLAFQYKPPKIWQHLSDEQKNRRIKFAITALQSGFNLSNIIFSDEVRVCLGPDNKLLWRRYGQDSDNIFEDSANFP